jgi:hypothetical protein
MKRVLLLFALAALAAAGAAAAKGPTAASIDGPGTGGGIDVGGSLAPGSPLAELSERTGLYPAVFRRTPDPMLVDRPKGDLGPKYAVTYTVPGPEGETYTLRQDVYPYAKPAPVTYMEPGQRVFRIETHGGWFVAGSGLKDTLVSAGLPGSPPTASVADDSALVTAELISALAAAVLLLGAATVIFVRRRERAAAAA